MPVPAQLESLWNEARRAAEAGLEQERQELERLAAELDSRLATMEATVLEATHARALAESRLLERNAELDRTLVLVEDLRAQRDHSEAKRTAAEAALELERLASLERWQRLADPIDAVRCTLSELQSQGHELGDLVRSSARSVAADLAEFSALERQSRVSSYDLLRRDIANIAEPLPPLQASVAGIERQFTRLSRARPRARKSGSRRRPPVGLSRGTKGANPNQKLHEAKSDNGHPGNIGRESADASRGGDAGPNQPRRPAKSRHVKRAVFPARLLRRM